MTQKEDSSIRLATLSPTKRALVEKMRLGKNGGATGPNRISEKATFSLGAASIGDERFQPFPLTDVQQAYWVGRMQGLELGNVAAHSYQEREYTQLNLSRLNVALQRLIERHDMLRAIVLPDGRQQILEEVPPYQIHTSDLRGLDQASAASQLKACRDSMSHQVRIPDQWPLFDLRAFLVDDRLTRLFISFDILIADIWSIRIISSELAILYEDPDAKLEPLQLLFRDYVLAEISSRNSEQYTRAYKYWLSRIPSLPPAPELPLAVSPASVREPKFTARAAKLDAPLWKALKRKTSKKGLTPSGLLLAAFAEVLASWSKSARFTINLTLFNREPIHPQVSKIVGDFTSLCLVEVDSSDGNSFEERARRIQQQLWVDLEHRHVSGVQVMRELTRFRGRMSKASMPVVFTSDLVLDIDGMSNGPTALQGDTVYAISQTPQVWLDHQVFEQAGELLFNWDAVEELFPEHMLDDMFACYCELLERLAEDDRCWDGSARMLTHTQRPAVLQPIDSNGSGKGVALPADRLVATLTDDVSTETPDGQDIVNRITRLAIEVLNVEAIERNRNLLECGATSIDLVRIANQLEIQFGVRISLEDLFDNPTIGAISQFYVGQLSRKADFLNWVPDLPGPQVDSNSEPFKLLLDPIERELFKKGQPGLRNDLIDMPSVELPGQNIEEEVLEVFSTRRSHREFLLKPVPLARMSRLLSCVRQLTVNEEIKYWYPSAGGIYSVGTYLHVKAGRVEGLAPGTYYYKPVEHLLVPLARNVELPRTVHGWVNRPIFDQAAFSIFLIGHLNAIKPLYGELARDFCMYEAGSMGQLMMMVAPSQQIGLCGIGGLEFESIRHLFLLNESHILLHSLLGGFIDQHPTRRDKNEDQSEQGDVQRIGQMLQKLKQLSRAEVEALLAEKNKLQETES